MTTTPTKTPTRTPGPLTGAAPTTGATTPSVVRCLPQTATEPTSSTPTGAPEARPGHRDPRRLGEVVEEITTDFCGEIVAVDRDLDTVTLEDRRRTRRTFPLGPGFLIDGKPVVLTRPTRQGAPAKPTRTASGSVAVDGVKARVARASRIFVEGRHDAELVEKVWGDDLRIEGVVVEYLGGVDDLSDHLRDFKPGPDRKVGVLVDHLVKGSKESRIAQGIARSAVGKHVLIVGHPFIDIWAAVKPQRLASSAGRTCRGPSSGSTACASSSAGRTATRPTSPGPGSTSSAGCGRSRTSTRHC